MQPRTFTTLLTTIIVVNMLPLFATSLANPISQRQSFVNYLIPNMNGWHYTGENPKGDSYMFQNIQQNITISLKKEPVLCENSQEFNKIVLKTIQELPKTQEYMEQRKSAVPYPFLEQKNGHLLIVKSRATNQRRFFLNYQIGTDMYQVEVTETSNPAEPSAETVAFIGQIKRGDGKGAPPMPESPIAANAQPDKPVASSPKGANSGSTESGTGVGRIASTANTTDITGVSSQIVSTASSGIKSEPAKTSQVSTVAISEDSSNTSTGALSQYSSADYDPALSAKAALIPDGDEEAQVINPAGQVTTISREAGWSLGLAKNPSALLDALEGGRPGGDVHALMALLRQTQGPFDEEEDQAMFKKYAPYIATGSSKAHKAIRNHSESLMQAMIQRQLMMQAAWEYDFAIAQNEIASLMKDEEEMEITSRMAEMQRSVMQELQTSIENILRQAEAAPQIPTPSELDADEKKERKDAVAALGLEGESKSKDPEKRTVGYLKYEGTHLAIREMSETEKRYYQIKPEEYGIVEKQGDNSVSFYLTSKIGSGYKPGTQDIWEDNVIESYVCSWEKPATIPVFATVQYYADGSANWYGGKAPFNIVIKDKGSKPHANKGVVGLGVGVGRVGSVSGGNMPDEKTPQGELNYWFYSDHVMLRVPESGEPFNNQNSTLGSGEYHLDGKLSEIPINKPEEGINYIYICITDETNMGAWTAYLRFKWEPVSLTAGVPSTPTAQDPSLGDEKNEAIAEHESNIAAARKTLESIRRELGGEKDPGRREELRLQALHMEQNIHDSKDLIESIKTGALVKTRGPWDEHSAIVLAETSRKLREDFQRASQMQASYVHMLNILKKYNPQEAEKFRQSMSSGVVKGIFEPGGFDRAQQAINALHAATKSASQIEQKKLESDQSGSFERLATIERHLRYAETIKSGCDKAIFVGTLFTGMGAGLALSMAYEGACTGVEKGPREALKNMAIQGTTMLLMAGTMKAGSWGINKMINPKVVKSEVNTFKNILEANRYQQEMDWNRALVNQLKDRARDFERCKATGGKNYLEVRKALDEAVSAANSSGLAKRIMKNELTMLENQIKSGAINDYSKLKECLSYQGVFNNRLQKSIYPRADAGMINNLRKQGYNVEKSWFQEYRNASSRGVNADRDLGLLSNFEKQVTKNGQPVSMGQFMDEAQKVYDQSYKAITGRSAKLADQSITTSAHSESFPVSWLQKKMEGPYTTLDPPVTPGDFEKAGKAIYNKVQNALSGPDPAFLNMKKACASLSKDLNTKVLNRLKNAPATGGGSSVPQQAAIKHWEQVQKVMEDFATDRCDPLTTMKRLQQLTGSTSISQCSAEVQRLLNAMGGA